LNLLAETGDPEFLLILGRSQKEKLFGRIWIVLDFTRSQDVLSVMLLVDLDSTSWRNRLNYLEEKKTKRMLSELFSSGLFHHHLLHRLSISINYSFKNQSSHHAMRAWRDF